MSHPPVPTLDPLPQTAAGASDVDASSDFTLWRRVNLIYLVFVFLPLLLDRSLRADANAWLASLAAIAVFLPLYWHSYVARPGAQLPIVLAMLLIGCVLTPISFGGNTFVIYALATVGWSMAVPHAVLFYGLASLVYAAVLKLSGMPLMLLLPVAMIGGVVMFGAMLGRIQDRRNAVLRLTQDEVRRLARMNERERIGRDLHDLLVAVLARAETQGRGSDGTFARVDHCFQRRSPNPDGAVGQQRQRVRRATVAVDQSGRLQVVVEVHSNSI